MVLIDVYLWITLILAALILVVGGVLGAAAILRRRRNRRMLTMSLTGLKMAGTSQEAQRRSFAYGNTKLSNEAITRELVDEAAERMGGDE